MESLPHNFQSRLHWLIQQINRLLKSLNVHNCVGPQQGRKVFTLQTLPGIDEPCNGCASQAAGFSLHAGGAASANQRDKLERLCRYITRPAVLAP